MSTLSSIWKQKKMLPRKKDRLISTDKTYISVLL